MIVDDGANPVAQAVARGIALGELRQRRLQLDAQNRAVRHAFGEAKTDRADACAEVEDALAGGRVDGGGQQHGIDGYTIAPARLQQAQAPPSRASSVRAVSMVRTRLASRHRVATFRDCGRIILRSWQRSFPWKASARLRAWSRCWRSAPTTWLRVDREILIRMRSPVALIPELANHLVGAGGKRMRPLLTVAAARLCGYAADDDRHIKLATCVEFIHSATLLHDDVVDVSALRRGRPTANSVWGDKASVLVGDFLFTRSFELMVDVGSLDVLGVLSRASSTIAEGEVLQLVTQRDISTPEATYLEVIKGKTAKLFAAAAEVGAMVAGRNGAGARGARKLRHESRHRLPAGRRCARLCRSRSCARQDGRRRLPRGQDHPAGHPVLPARRRRRSRVLEAHHREARPARRRPVAGAEP